MAEIATTVRIAPVADAAPATVTPSPAQVAANRAVAGAVRALNETNYSGDGREITFSVDRATHLPVVKVVDKNTKEVLQQWPQQYVLNLAESLK